MLFFRKKPLPISREVENLKVSVSDIKENPSLIESCYIDSRGKIYSLYHDNALSHLKVAKMMNIPKGSLKK